MARPRNTVPTKNFHVALPETLISRIEILLYSSFEQRVPPGALKRFFTERLTEFFDHETLDLAPWMGPQAPPGVWTIRGPRSTLLTLTNLLQGANHESTPHTPRAEAGLPRDS